MARDGWFDGTGFDLSESTLADVGGRIKGYGSDCRFTRTEWLEQRKKVFELLRGLEGRLDDEAHALATQVVREYEVLCFVSQHVEEKLSWSDSDGQLNFI